MQVGLGLDFNMRERKDEEVKRAVGEWAATSVGPGQPFGDAAWPTAALDASGPGEKRK